MVWSALRIRSKRLYSNHAKIEPSNSRSRSDFSSRRDISLARVDIFLRKDRAQNRARFLARSYAERFATRVGRSLGYCFVSRGLDQSGIFFSYGVWRYQSVKKPLIDLRYTTSSCSNRVHAKIARDINLSRSRSRRYITPLTTWKIQFAFTKYPGNVNDHGCKKI